MARITSKLFCIPEGATYVRVHTYGCVTGDKIRYNKQHKHDVFVGYSLKDKTETEFPNIFVYTYEIYDLRQYDYPICIPVDAGGCYDGDMSEYPNNGWKHFPCEAIPVKTMLERMGRV
jgi:hypothetical protein